MSGQIYFQETADDAMAITARRGVIDGIIADEVSECEGTGCGRLNGGGGRRRDEDPKLESVEDPDCTEDDPEDCHRRRRLLESEEEEEVEEEEAGQLMSDIKGRKDETSGELVSSDYEEERAIDRDVDLFSESYGVWVHDQCEPFSMFTADDIIEYEAFGMTAEFNASNESSTAAIDSDSLLIGAGIGAVAMLLVVGLFAMIMKWRKSAAKQQESEVSKVVDAPNVVHVEDDSAEVAKVEGTATVAV